MSQSGWVCLQMSDDRTKMGNLEKYAKCKGKFGLFTSYEPKSNYDASGVVLYEIFKTHNTFFVG